MMIPEAELALLERVRARTLSLTEGLGQADLDRRPAGGGWSVGEILDHLLRTEVSNRREIAALIALARAGRKPYIRRTLTADGVAPAFVPRSLLPFLSLPVSLMTLFIPAPVRQFLVRTRLLAVNASEELQPERGRPAGELRGQLAAVVTETRALLTDNADLDFRRMVHQQPFFGSNNVPGMLRLTASHEERHQTQIRQVLGR